MSSRKIPFENEEYYHVFNRGVDKRIVFTDKQELDFFFSRLSALNNTVADMTGRNHRRSNYTGKARVEESEGLVSVVAYCLLPNHFHLLLKQNVDQGISKFMQRLGTSYTVFFNQKHQRNGSLFQGKFKAKHLTGEYGLSTVATYVNLNYQHHKINPKENLVKSSIFEYLQTEQGKFICDETEVKNVMSEIGTIKAYKKYAKNLSIVFARNKGIELSDKDFEM
ncbi:MAG: hypothetical protein Ctma_0360 [Catillopecten margaritatus gill symbiont]|uniref:Transposase IS200-like domain-containing protein n=1 Tax=Catillopecten margaritatus gill symbiont TaxID=3083288 RepID=A0AAU6PF84_9GAMM